MKRTKHIILFRALLFLPIFMGEMHAFEQPELKNHPFIQFTFDTLFILIKKSVYPDHLKALDLVLKDQEDRLSWIFNNLDSSVINDPQINQLIHEFESLAVLVESINGYRTPFLTKDHIIKLRRAFSMFKLRLRMLEKEATLSPQVTKMKEEGILFAKSMIEKVLDPSYLSLQSSYAKYLFTSYWAPCALAGIISLSGYYGVKGAFEKWQVNGLLNQLEKQRETCQPQMKLCEEWYPKLDKTDPLAQHYESFKQDLRYVEDNHVDGHSKRNDCVKCLEKSLKKAKKVGPCLESLALTMKLKYQFRFLIQSKGLVLKKKVLDYRVNRAELPRTDEQNQAYEQFNERFEQFERIIGFTGSNLYSELIHRIDQCRITQDPQAIIECNAKLEEWLIRAARTYEPSSASIGTIDEALEIMKKAIEKIDEDYEDALSKLPLDTTDSSLKKAMTDPVLEKMIIENELKCISCLESYLECGSGGLYPIICILQCGHHLCLTCLDTWKKTERKVANNEVPHGATCPNCRNKDLSIKEQITFESFVVRMNELLKNQKQQAGQG